MTTHNKSIAAKVVVCSLLAKTPNEARAQPPWPVSAALCRPEIVATNLFHFFMMGKQARTDR